MIKEFKDVKNQLVAIKGILGKHLINNQSMFWPFFRVPILFFNCCNAEIEMFSIMWVLGFSKLLNPRKCSYLAALVCFLRNATYKNKISLLQATLR